MMIKFLFGFGGISTIAKVLKGVLILALLALVYFFVMWSWHFIAQKEPKTKAEFKKINLQVDSLKQVCSAWMQYSKGVEESLVRLDSLRMDANTQVEQYKNKEASYQRTISDLTKSVKFYRQNGACFEKVKVKKGLFKSEFILVPIVCDSNLTIK